MSIDGASRVLVEEHDAIAGFAGAKMLERVVDPRHRKRLGDGEMPCLALKSSIRSRAVGLPAGEPETGFLSHDQTERGHLQGLKNGANDMEPALRCESVQQSRASRNVDGGDNEIEAAGDSFSTSSLLVLAQNGPQLARLCFLCSRLS